MMSTADPVTHPDGSRRPTVVVFRLGSLGDTVAALPCFHAIARRFPDHRRLVLTNVPVASNAAPLLAVLGDRRLVHGAIAYPAGLRNLGELWTLRRRLKAEDARSLVYLAPQRGGWAVLRDWLFFKACGFRQVLGMPWSRDLRRCRVDAATGLVEREASRLARSVARDVGPADLDAPSDWDLLLSEDDLAVARRSLTPLGERPFIAVNMGGKVVEKDWGQANWTALLRSLGATISDHGLVVLGAESDRERAEALKLVWSGPLLNLCGRLAPRESAAVLEEASLFIGHDSGPLHLAAVSGAPSVGLFGAYNRPVMWHPVGDHVRILHNLSGLEQITVAETAAAAEDMLTRAGRRAPQPATAVQERPSRSEP
jgi:ADP-heptose:LPS heptosyltransferase